MDKYVISGGNPLKGKVRVSGAKNVAMKVILAGLLTDERLTIRGVPHISSVAGTADIGKPLVPNPGGCRIGLRPIDMHIEGLRIMGAKIDYNSKDGYFYASSPKSLEGINFRFKKNTHTGTETLILAAVLANGTTILENAAEEPEIDDLIDLLNKMGGDIKREKNRKIIIKGVAKLHGTEFEIMPDRNEVVTYAAAAIATRGDIIVEGTQNRHIKSFLKKLD